MLTYSQYGPVAFIGGQFHKRSLSHQSLKLVWEATCIKLHLNLTAYDEPTRLSSDSLHLIYNIIHSLYNSGIFYRHIVVYFVLFSLINKMLFDAYQIITPTTGFITLWLVWHYTNRELHRVVRWPKFHYSDVIMSTMAPQITGVLIVCSNVCSGAGQRKYQSSAPRAFVGGIHRWPLDSPHKGPVTRKMFPFDDVIMNISILNSWHLRERSIYFLYAPP